MIEPVFCLLLWRENERALLSHVWSGIRPYVMYRGGVREGEEDEGRGGGEGDYFDISVYST